ncbi:MAG: ABC transporter permease [Clostridium sp.]|nr:ABC transporter permease [Clostridium sp.]
MKRKQIVHYVTKQYMRLNKKRTFTTFVGIVFMVLLMTCVFVGKDTAIGYLQEVSSRNQGKWHFVINHATKEQRQRVEELGYIAALSESVNLGTIDFLPSANAERPYLNVKAYGRQCFDWYNIKLIRGRLPENAEEIVISVACLDDGADIQIGDTIEAAYFHRTLTGTQTDGANQTVFPYYNLVIGKGDTTAAPLDFPYYGENESFRENKEMTGKEGHYTVTGIIEVPFFEAEAGAGYTAITLLDDNIRNEADDVNLSLQIDFERASEYPYMDLKEIAGEDNLEANDYYLAFSGDSADSTMNQLVNMMTVFFVLLIGFASVILIYNVFNLSFRERSRYLGMLSLVGATARQKRSSIYYEAFILLLFALPVGILSGFGVIYLGMNLLQPYIRIFVYAGLSMEPVPVTLLIRPEALLIIVAASVITVLVSAFLPAKKIGRTGAVEGVRGNAGEKSRLYKMNRKAIKNFGAERMLAQNSLSRQRRKRRSISLSVIIFLVILVVTAFGSASVHTVIEKKIANGTSMSLPLQENEYSFCFTSEVIEADSFEAEWEKYEAVKEELSRRPDITRIVEWYDTMFVGQIDNAFFSEEYKAAHMDIVRQYVGDQMSREEIEQEYELYVPANIQVVDDDTLADMAKRCGADEALLADESKQGVIVMNEGKLSTDSYIIDGGKPERYRYYDIAHISDLQPGDSFVMKYYSVQAEAEEEFPFTIAGYGDNDSLADYIAVDGEFVWLIMGKTTAARLAEAFGRSSLAEMMSTELRITMEEKDGDLEEYLQHIADSSESLVFMPESYREIENTMTKAVARIVDIMLICFVLLTSVICLMNLRNSVYGRMADRRQEFAVMKSVGMTRGQIRTMLLWECGGILLEGMLVAVVASSVLIVGMRYVLSSLFGRLALKIPYLLVLAAAVLTAGMVILLTLRSFGREKEENILENIRNESV